MPVVDEGRYYLQGEDASSVVVAINCDVVRDSGNNSHRFTDKLFMRGITVEVDPFEVRE